MANLSQLFSKNLRRFRKATKLSQRNFSEIAAIGEKSLIRLENGQGGIKFATLEKLARALDVPPSSLFADESVSESDLLNTKISHAIKGLSPEKLEIVYNLVRDLKKI